MVPTDMWYYYNKPNQKHLMSKRKLLLLTAALLLSTLTVIILLPERRNQIKTPHFTFNFSASIDTSTLSALTRSLEENYGKIGTDLKTDPSSNLEVNLYAQRWRYVKATGNWNASGSIEGISRLHFVEQAWGEPDINKVAIHEF